MESSSQPNKIQVSQKTAELVVSAGKGHLFSARKDMVNAKGTGLLQTYWLNPKKSKTTGSVVSSIDDLETDASLSCFCLALDLLFLLPSSEQTTSAGQTTLGLLLSYQTEACRSDSTRCGTSSLT
jgi:hypothetical protein